MFAPRALARMHVWHDCVLCAHQVFDMGSSERNECMNEIRLLQSMKHPHIIDYLDCVIEHNELTVVMELVDSAPPHRAQPQSHLQGGKPSHPIAPPGGPR